MLLTLCQGQPSIALWPNRLVQFTPTEHNRQWAQLVCQKSPPVHVLPAFKLFLGGIKSVPMPSIMYIYAANYPNLTSSLVPSVSAVSSGTSQQCGLPCARLNSTDGKWHGCELPRKFTVLQLAPFRMPIICILIFVLLKRNKIAIWQHKKRYSFRKEYGGV